MTMEQGRRLAMLEARLDAIDAAWRTDRQALVLAISRLSESVHRLRCAVTELERERYPVPRVGGLERPQESVAP